VAKRRGARARATKKAKKSNIIGTGTQLQRAMLPGGGVDRPRESSLSIGSGHYDELGDQLGEAVHLLLHSPEKNITHTERQEAWEVVMVDMLYHCNSMAVERQCNRQRSRRGSNTPMMDLGKQDCDDTFSQVSSYDVLY
jgi:hypothetical protein